MQTGWVACHMCVTWVGIMMLLASYFDACHLRGRAHRRYSVELRPTPDEIGSASCNLLALVYMELGFAIYSPATGELAIYTDAR